MSVTPPTTCDAVRDVVTRYVTSNPMRHNKNPQEIKPTPSNFGTSCEALYIGGVSFE